MLGKNFATIIDNVYGMKVEMYGHVIREGMLKATLVVSELSLSSVPSFLKNVRDAQGFFPEDLYLVLMFKSFHNLLLGKSKLIKNHVLGHLDSRGLCTSELGRVTVGRTVLSPNANMFRACSVLPAPDEKECPKTALPVDFSKGKFSSRLNGLSISAHTCGILEVKDYQCIEMVLPFTWGYVDKVSECIEDVELMKMNTIYSKLLL